jgi:hypothetical protein
MSYILSLLFLERQSSTSFSADGGISGCERDCAVAEYQATADPLELGVP